MILSCTFGEIMWLATYLDGTGVRSRLREQGKDSTVKTYIISVLDGLFFHPLLDGLACLAAEQEQLHPDAPWRFSGLPSQDLRKVVLIILDSVHELQEILRSIVLRELAPRWKCRPSGSYGQVDILLYGYRHLGKGLFGAGINCLRSLYGGHELGVNDIVESRASSVASTSKHQSRFQISSRHAGV